MNATVPSSRLEMHCEAHRTTSTWNLNLGLSIRRHFVRVGDGPACPPSMHQLSARVIRRLTRIVGAGRGKLADSYLCMIGGIQTLLTDWARGLKPTALLVLADWSEPQASACWLRRLRP